MKKLSVGQALTLATVAGFAALLFAPKKGEQLRQHLKQGLNELAWEVDAFARDFVNDFKTSYIEADEQVRQQQQLALDRQKRLEQTIAEIEADLKRTPRHFQ
ncbi:YtxH domain-containing protein [Allofustis seminis]|uniref:YtxH domain-containing protein n=1 Tax=Allofustis seminis TaxID=166939 RepID=UPI0003725FFA|nr:YtxH domain-containing protein [Allofustis seminis]